MDDDLRVRWHHVVDPFGAPVDEIDDAVRVFVTTVGHERWNNAARHNLTNEIADLRSVIEKATSS